MCRRNKRVWDLGSQHISSFVALRESCHVNLMSICFTAVACSEHGRTRVGHQNTSYAATHTGTFARCWEVAFTAHLVNIPIALPSHQPHGDIHRDLFLCIDRAVL